MHRHAGRPKAAETTMTGTLTAPYCRYDVEQMTVTQLLVAEGAAFVAETPLYEVEIDKTITEVAAAAAGRLCKWLVAKGDVVSVGQPVAEVEGAAAAAAHGGPPPQETCKPALHEQPPRSVWISHATLSVAVKWDRVESALRSRVGDAADLPTTTTILAECLRQALRNRKKLWKVQASDGHLLGVSSLAVGVAVAREDDELTTAVVDDAFEHSAHDFTRQVQSAIAAARSGETKSLRNVPIVISDLSLYGIRHGVPVVVPPSIATLLLGEAYTANATGSAAGGTRCANLALSFDHRCINGVGAASLLADLKRRLETFAIAGESGSGPDRDIPQPGGVAAGSTGEVLRAIICELLATAAVEPASTFWSLGADSMMAAELVARINGRFKLDLLIHDVYENPTLLALERLILDEARPRALTGRALAPRVGRGPAPLTYRQEARWKDFQHLGMALNSRSTARAFRLQGPLDVARLVDAVDELVRRHEALRTRIVTIEGAPMQRVDDPSPRGLQIFDLQGVPQRHRELEAQRLVEELVNEPLDMATGPPFGARLLQLDHDDHVVAFAADHMLADRASADLMTRELHALYVRDSPHDSPLSLPRVPVQLADYAIWQRETREAWLGQHRTYWSERLRGAPRLQLPIDAPASAGSGGWRVGAIQFDEPLRNALHQLSRREDSTLALTVLTAYVALVLRWCDAREMIVAVMTDGRGRPEIQHTVGFFASDLYLRVQLGAADSFRDLHRQITEEYGRALRHQDCGLLPALMPEARLASVPSFNWYQMDATPALQDACGRLRTRPFHIRRELRELQAEGDLSIFGGQPWVGLTDELDRIAGCVLYRPGHFKEGTMAAVARNLPEFASNLVQNPEGRVASLTPACQASAAPGSLQTSSPDRR